MAAKKHRVEDSREGVAFLLAIALFTLVSLGALVLQLNKMSVLSGVSCVACGGISFSGVVFGGLVGVALAFYYYKKKHGNGYVCLASAGLFAGVFFVLVFGVDLDILPDQIYCRDTDDGNDPFTAGLLQTEGVEHYDSCRDAYYLEEKVCSTHPNTGLPEPSFVLVYCKFGCKTVVGRADRCLTGCEDSDGVDYFVKGTVVVSSKVSGTYVDSCVDSDTVKEYSCYRASSGDWKMVSQSYGCPVACSGGQCVSTPSPTVTSTQPHSTTTQGYSSSTSTMASGVGSSSTVVQGTVTTVVGETSTEGGVGLVVVVGLVLVFFGWWILNGGRG